MVAKRALSFFSICLGAAAFTAAVAIAPAEAKKNKSTEIEEAIPEADADQPMTLVISLGSQKVDIYRGMTLITTSRVSTGKRGYATKAGVFSILEKRRHHFSNLYGGAPMPWMQRLTWSGTALHAGVVPGYPASHGCVRLPYSFAPKLFAMTNVGAQVVVAHGKVAPKPIEHTALFQPLPPPMPPTLVTHEERPTTTLRRSSNDAAPAFSTRLPVVLAKAETILPESPPAVEARVSAPAIAQAASEAPAHLVSAAVHEDTRAHAIDPNAAPFGGSPAHALAVRPSSVPQDHAAAGSPDDFAKDQGRLAAPVEAQETPSSRVISAAATSVAQPATPSPLAMTTPENQQAPEPRQSDEPQAGAILTVSATALAQPVPAPVSVAVTMLGPKDHPPLPRAKPSVVAAKLVAGTAAAAVEAAEPRSTEPLRILITRRTQRDRMIDVQHMLASMGFLETQDFDGTFGALTARAIKAFQKANDMPETGAFTDDLVKKVYEVAGRGEPPAGHLFVRQKFAGVFNTPVGFRNPDAPLGTHVFTVMNFAPGDTKAEWMAISLRDDDDPMAALDRIEIPDDIRRKISERLTPGSTLIIAETAINSATLPKGADFLVWDTSKPATVQRASVSSDDVSPRPRKKRRVTTQRRPTYTRSYDRRGPWPF